jgi:hypothetical protein
MAYETSKIGTLLKITLMSNFEFFSSIWKLSTGTTGEKVKFSYEKSSVTITSGNTVEKNGAFNFLQHLIQKIEKYYMFWLLW